MTIRSRAARWFEVVVPRADAHDVLETLARRGGVQFEWRGERPAANTAAGLDGPLARYRDLSGPYARLWPEPVFRRRCCTLPVEDSARASIRQLEHWLEQAGPALDRLDSITAELSDLARWRGVLEALGTESIDLGVLTRCGPTLAGYCLVWPPDTEPTAAGEDELVLDLALGDGGRARIGLAAADRLIGITEGARPRGGDTLAIPDWLDGPPQRCLQTLGRVERERTQELRQIESGLRELAERRGLQHALGTLERIAWFRDAAADMRCDGALCWITGWTGDTDAGEMTRALRRVGVETEVAIAEPPEDASLPSLSELPVWARPFEVLTRAVGVPGVGEADPTTWLAMLVPLIFGFMCGDVGHGLVIAGMGLLLMRRTRHWPLLLWCGLAATGFGFVFGDVFGYEDLVPALWLRPLDAPLAVLLVPVAGGSLVLTLGVLLHTVQTCWRGDGALHWIADLGQLLAYWGALLAFFDLRAGWMILGGVLVCVTNRLVHDPSPVKLLAGFGALLESTFSLLLNTISFARIGAFALAHAALEGAIVSTADAMSSVALAALVAVIGNLVVIALEALVVSIQTSRLVLYEFLTRFFEGRGRAFEPAARPPGPPRPG